MGRSNRNFILERLSQFVSASVVLCSSAIIILLWEAVCRGFKIPHFMLPPPSSVISALIVQIMSKMIFIHIYTTLVEILWGFFIGNSLGLVLGILVGEFKLLERIVYPFVVSFQALPKVAIAPLIVLWFGFGLGSKMILVAVVVFFPILVNVVTGMQSTNQDLLLMMRSIPATRWQIFKMLKLPSSLPYIFAGLDVGATLSVIGAVVGEFVGSERGLGNLVLQMSYNFDIGGMFSVFLMLSGIGLILHFIVVYFQKKLIFWIR